MSKIIVPIEILGDETTKVLRREVNSLCIEENKNGDEIWNYISMAKSLDEIKNVLKENFGNALKVV